MLFHLLAGIGICVQPLYLGEVAPKHLRGGMAMGSSIFLTGGILTGQIIGLRLEMHFFFLPCVTHTYRIPIPCSSLQNINCGHCSISESTSYRRSTCKKKTPLLPPYSYKCKPSVLSPQENILSLDGLARTALLK